MRTITLLSLLFLFIACQKIETEQQQSHDKGNNGSPQDTTTSTTTTDTTDHYRTSHHPKALTLYNNAHVIVFSDAFHPDSAEITLISYFEWDNITSALNTENPTIATLLASGYEEPSETSSVASWHIPSIEEAKRLRALYNTTQPALDTLNTLLQTIGAPPITTTTGSNTRYLCDEAKRTFSFAQNTTISQAGTKTPYRLRLLKTLRIHITP